MTIQLQSEDAPRQHTPRRSIVHKTERDTAACGQSSEKTRPWTGQSERPAPARLPTVRERARRASRRPRA